jgi:CRISPR-associated endonuclease/helicase Cas3
MLSARGRMVAGTMESPESAHDSYRVLWAKTQPRHALWKHLIDAAAVSLTLPPLGGRSGLSPQAVAMLVGLHDIGKADSVFQHRATELSEELTQAGYPVTADAPCRHERITAGFVRQRLEPLIDGRLVDTVSLALAAHHGYWDLSGRGVARPYANAQSELCAMLQDLLPLGDFIDAPPSDLSSFGMLLAGRVVLCDWIASNEQFYLDPRLSNVDDPREYLHVARQIAAEWVHRLGLNRPMRRAEPRRVVDCPRPLQQTLLEEAVPPGLVIIEAPMGEGKTEAAWILAEKWRELGYDGMYMALPTMATSDSLHERYRDSYLARMSDRSEVKLVHGMAWIRDSDEPARPVNVGESEEDRSLASVWFRPTRRAMLAAHGVGTIDQAMLAGMKVKFGFLRLYGLAGRVLVIDEMHAYDAYMSCIIARLLRWCASLRIPVVLLSATLSAQQRAAMIEAYTGAGGDPGSDAPYPLITVVEPGKPARNIQTRASQAKRLQVQCVPGGLGDAGITVAVAERLVQDGGCCCVVVNTVQQAQRVYEALTLPADEKLLFHARFTARDRKMLADGVLRSFGRDTRGRPHRFVLVATQVVEQSLDVDFDHMITDLAPMDLLLQRSGRLHRHRGRPWDPFLYVLTPGPGVLEFGGTGRVYEAKPLLRTLAILNALPGSGEVRLPDDFRRLIERCYGLSEWLQTAVPWQVIREADQQWDTNTRLLESQGGQFTLGEPRSRSFSPVGNDPVGDDTDDGTGWRAKTRLGASDRTALMIPADDVASLVRDELSAKEVRALYAESVRLPGYLPLDRPADGYGAVVSAAGRLKGLLLLPVDELGLWKGVDGRGGCIEVRYDRTLGLVVGRTP